MAFPSTLTNAVDSVTEIISAHLNNLEAKVGVDASAVVSSLDYLLRNVASVDPGHKHDHGGLQGLGDDDHTQYIRADGTRAFSGVVSGVTPTSAAHLATKAYVDGAVVGLEWQDSVKDKELTAPPGFPTTGHRYIVASVATGAWATHEKDIAQYNGATWDFITPNEGMAVWVDDEDCIYVYSGTAWAKMGTFLDHANLINLATGDPHTQYINHTLATAADDFLVASGVGAYVKKTLAETKTILELPASPYVIGDMFYASSTTVQAKLAAVAANNAMISGGIGAPPSWGKVGLTTHVSGILPVANGGTGASDGWTAAQDPGHKHSKLWASDGSPEAVTVDATGNVVVPGSITTNNGFYGIISPGYSAVGLNNYSNTNWEGNYFISRRARGTLAIPLIVADGDTLFVLDAQAYDGAIPGTFIRAGNIVNVVSGTPSAGIIPSAWKFSVANTAGTLTEVIRISPASNVGIGVTAFGTSAAKVLGIGSGTAPSTSPADMAQMWCADVGAVAGNAGLHLRTETGYVYGFGKNLLLGNLAAGASALGAVVMASGTAPTAWPVDGAQMCVKDQAAGNACFHFYTELGQIIKLYQQAALTAALTGITHTAPGTPDYALQDLVQNTGFGFATKDEGNSLLAVVASLQTRVNEVATILANCGLTA